MKRYGRRKTRRTFKRPARTFKKKSLKKKRRIARRAAKPEIKTFQQTFGTTSFNSVITNSGDILNLLPLITQGTQKYNRVGNKIFVKSFIVRMNIAWEQPAVTPAYAKVAIRAFIACPRFLNYGAAAVGDINQLLMVNNIPRAYDGTIDTHMAPVNKDYWRVKMDKRIYMDNPVYVQAGVGPFNFFPTGRKTIVKNIFKNKTLQWTQGNLYPVNFPWQMMFGFSPLDNITAGALVTTPFNVNYTVEIRFTDA